MLAFVAVDAENKSMNHEVPQSEDHVSFLSEFFAEKFNSVNPKWIDIEMSFAFWRVIALNDGSRKVLAYRTSPAGVVDSFSLNLDSSRRVRAYCNRPGLIHERSLQFD